MIETDRQTPLAAPGQIRGTDGPDRLVGGPDLDIIIGFGGNDTLEGGDGDDQLRGDQGDNRLIGGRGSDNYDLSNSGVNTIVINLGDSPVSAGFHDVVSDWASDDRLEFGVSAGAYAEVAVTSRAAGLVQANNYIAAGARYVAVEERAAPDREPILAVYVDTAGDGGAAEDVIFFINRGLADISAVNVGAKSTLGELAFAGPVDFESLTAAQAQGYNAAVNDLNFTKPGSGASTIAVNFQPDGTIQIYQDNGAIPRAVVFGPGMAGEANLVFSDGTRGVIGTSGADLLMGASTSDSLWGGPGNDTLNGGANPDRLYGGDGADLYVLPAYDTRPTVYDGIYGWEPIDRITFGGAIAGTAGNYAEVDSAAEAETRILSGAADYALYQSSGPFGASVSVLADVFGTNGVTGRAVLQGATLAQIDYSNFVASPLLAFPALPPLPGTATTAAPGPTTYVGRDGPLGGGQIEGNMDLLHIGDLQGGLVSFADASSFSAASSTVQLNFQGSGFTYRVKDGVLLDIPSGVITLFQGYIDLSFRANIYVPQLPAQTVFGWILRDDTPAAWGTLFGRSDGLTGGGNADLLRGFAGNDTIGGSGGDDTLWGGVGDDVIYATGAPGRSSILGTGSTYLRGEEGDDNLYGSGGFDDINGNMGNDTAGGGPGADWVVGGKDQDLLFGDDGADLVYGNLGNDTCEGGAGADTVRGGQDNDVVRGGAGDDFISGDKGSDTMTGGSGADVFHTFGESGVDWVSDFSRAEGDCVQVDPGTQYTVAQVGSDVVVTMAGGGVMTLVGVSLSSLTGSWIFGA